MKINFFLVLLMPLFISCGQINHINFYNKALKLENSVELKYQNKNLFLEAKRDLNRKENFLMVKKEYIVSGCKFFPLRDVIEKLLLEYCNQKVTYSPLVIIPTYSLVYQMLYYRYGNKERVKRYFREKLGNDYESEFFNFYLTKEEKEFMQLIHDQSISNQFYYSKDEVSFARKLGVQLRRFDLSMEIFEFVKMNVRKLPQDLKKILQEFAEQEDAFKLYTDYTLRKGLIININEYGSLYNSQIKDKEYVQYHNKVSTNKDSCVILLPVMDLMKCSNNSHSEDKTISVSIEIIPESGVNFSLDHTWNANSALGYSYNFNDKLQSKESLYVDYNIIDDQLRYKDISIPYVFRKENFSPLKASVCYLFRCGGFDINFFMSNPSIIFMEHDFILKTDELNRSLWNVIKLSHLNDRDIRIDVHSLLFEKNASLDYDTEKKSLVDYVKLVKDILTRTNENISQLIKDERDFTPVMKNLVNITRDKLYMYYNQIQVAEKEYANLIVKEIARFKEKLFA